MYFDPLSAWLVPVVGILYDKLKTACTPAPQPKPQPRYPEPHRDENGKIIIENSQLYYDDVKKHGAYQAQQWVRQGKYNLSPEELKIEQERIRKKFEKLYKL